MRFSEMAIIHTRKQRGEVPFKVTSLDSEHIRKIIKHVSQETGVSEQDIVKEMEQNKYILEMRQIAEEIKKISSEIPNAIGLYRNMMDNAAEYAALKIIGRAGKVDFDADIFNRLIQYIRAENNMMPMRSPDFSTKTRSSITIGKQLAPILVPNPDPRLAAKYNDIETAAATPDGFFIFNMNFMRDLINFAEVTGLRMDTPKYQSNGGDIPDSYGYIETLILHEFLHFRFGDFSRFTSLKKYSHHTHNVATDLRSNYILLKSGYPQLPLGLYSDEFNTDRDGMLSYPSLIAAVDNVLKRLSKDTNDKIKKSMDEHEAPRMEEDEESPEGGTPGGKPEEDEEEDGQGKGPKGKPDKDKNKKDSQGKGTGEKPNQSGNDLSPEEIEQLEREIMDEISKGKDLKPDELDKQIGNQPKSSGGSPGRGKMSQGQQITLPTPTFNWQGILQNFVPFGKPQIDYTRSRPPKNVATAYSGLDTAGGVALKPGEKVIEDDKFKLLMMLDSSGSMNHHIPEIVSNVNALITQRFSDINGYFGFGMFSDGEKYFAINPRGNYAIEIVNFRDGLENPKGQKITPANEVFRKPISGGTSFHRGISDDLAAMASKGYNILLTSDKDIYDQMNWKNFLNLYSAARNKLFFIANNQDTYQEIIKRMGITKNPPTNFSHF